MFNPTRQASTSSIGPICYNGHNPSRPFDTYSHLGCGPITYGNGYGYISGAHLEEDFIDSVVKAIAIGALIIIACHEYV